MTSLRDRRLRRLINTHDIRRRAKRLPKAVFDAIDGGATDEITVRANASAYDRIWLRPRALADVSALDTSTTILGKPVSMPLMLAPCGFALMTNREAELPAARAAGAAGTVFAVSGAASKTLEEIADVATGPLWYQLYLPPNRKGGAEIIDRAAAAGYDTLCLTIDSAVLGKRERDFRNQLTIPLKPSPRLAWTAVRNPRWAVDFALGGLDGGGGINGARQAVGQFAETVTNAKPVTLEDLLWVRERWKGTLVVKGVQRSDEVEAILDAGADAIVVSNHGGRMLDTVRPTIEVLPEVVEAVDGRAEVLIDGGIRRGTDVVKAVALGAQACLIGRPYMFGMSVAGEAGAARVLEILRTEIAGAMGNLGCARVGDLDRTLIGSGLTPSDMVSCAYERNRDTR